MGGFAARLMEALRSRSFRTKLLMASIACIVIPACISLTVSSYLTRDALKEQAVANARENLQLVDSAVSNLFKFMLYVTNYIQVDSEINTVLKNRAAGFEYEGSDAAYAKFEDDTRIIQKLDNLSIAGERSYVTIIQPNGDFFANYSVGDFDPRLIMEEPWFEELNRLRGFETYWVGTQPNRYLYDRKNHPFQLSIARTLRNTGSQIYGYVIVTIFEDQVSELFRTLTEGQEIMLLDDGGKIHSHVDPARIGAVFSYDRDGSDIVRLDGEDYLVTEKPLTYSGWRLLLLTPYEEAIANINAVYRTVFVFQLIAFFAFLLLLVYLIRTFTKPLKRLGKVAETVRRGNLEVRSHIRGRDELGALGTSFDQMLDRIKRMIGEITLEQTKKRKAELAMLQAQIHPHFLFNVLNSIRLTVLRRGDPESAEMISSLSKLLRMTIERDRGEIELQEELETVADYVRLMNMRQREKVTFSADVPTGVGSWPVPRFFLQPVIENAFIHGLNRRAGTIRVEAELADGELAIRVRDDGAGMTEAEAARLQERLAAGTPEGAAASGAGAGAPVPPDGLAERASREAARGPGQAHGRGFSSLGLANVYERMRLTFGEAFRMEIRSAPGEGTTVTMRIPAGKEGEDEDAQGDGR